MSVNCDIIALTIFYDTIRFLLRQSIVVDAGNHDITGNS